MQQYYVVLAINIIFGLSFLSKNIIPVNEGSLSKAPTWNPEKELSKQNSIKQFNQWTNQ